MAIAQMNRGRMLYPLEDPRMKEFTDQLDVIYSLAKQARGFIWRIDDNQIAQEMSSLGDDRRTSATVSVWESVSDLHDFTFQGQHGEYFNRAPEWFEVVKEPQFVMWTVDKEAMPSYANAQQRLDYLKRYGNSDYAYGWPK
jgi:hypothetical protein